MYRKLKLLSLLHINNTLFQENQNQEDKIDDPDNNNYDNSPYPKELELYEQMTYHFVVFYEFGKMLVDIPYLLLSLLLLWRLPTAIIQIWKNKVMKYYHISLSLMLTL